MHRLAVALSLAGAGAALLAGCGTVRYQPTAATAGAVAARPCTTISGWDTTHGSALRAEKKQLLAHVPKVVNGARAIVADSGDFAYSSVPQVFTRPGRYTFDFGPLTSSLHWGTTTRAVTFDFPADFPVVFTPAPGAGPAKVVTIGGRQYLRASFIIKALPHDRTAPAACSDLVLWMY